jgi:hypothetical protein
MRSRVLLPLLLILPALASAQQLAWPADGLPVCTADGWQRTPDLVTDGDRGAITAWEDIRLGSDPAIYAARITADGTLPWQSDGVRVSDHHPGQRLAGIVEDGSGGAYIAWWNRKNGDLDVYVQHIDASGTALWDADGKPVGAAQGNQQWAELIADGAGGVIIAWHDRRGADNDIYAQRLNAAGKELWNPGGTLVSGAEGDQSYPQLASDQHGGAFIVWMDRRTEDDLYAQRVLGGGNLAWPDDIPVCVEPNRQIAPKIMPFGDDEAAVFWQDFRFGAASSALYLQVIEPDGSLYYPDDYQVSLAESAQTGMFLTSDGVKGTMAIWTDFRSSPTDGDIFMRRILADGTFIGDFGNALCVYNDMQERPTIITDGFGGGFGVWQDRRNGFDYDLYMNRVSARGLTDYDDWNRTGGLLLVKADNNQLAPQVIGSGRGAAIVVWYDGRVMDGQADIYAQRIAYSPWIEHPDSMEFGYAKMGETVNDTITIANTGATNMTITNIRRASGPGTQPQDFIVVPDFTLPLTIPPDSAMRLIVQFAPTGAEDRVSELRINSNAPEEPVIIPLHGIGTSPRISTVNRYTFGAAKVGVRREATITQAIRNLGNGPLLVTELRVSGADSLLFGLGSLPAYPLVIPTGGSLDLPVTFTPDIVGPKTAELLVFSNAQEETESIDLTGIGANPSFISIPLALHFDTTMETRTQELPLRLRNTSGVELVIQALSFSGDAADQFSTDATVPIKIGGDQSEEILITFAPTSPGFKQANLVVESDDPKTPHTIRIDGAATVLGVASPASAAGFTLHAQYPHPWSLSAGTPLYLTVTTPAASDVRLELLDLLGRRVALIHDGALPPGSSTLQWNPGAMAPAPGTYLLRMSAVNAAASRAVVLSRLVVVVR